MKLVKGISVLSAAILLAACGGDDNDSKPAVYEFDSQFISGESAVSHSGQATRHILISELKNLIGSDELQDAATKADALAMLNAVYAKGTKDNTGNLITTNVYTGGATATPVSISLKTTDVTLKQADFTDVSGDKNLQGKIAGKDNLLTNAELVGWTIATTGDNSVKGEGVNAAPELLVQQWFDQIAELAVDGDATTKYVTEDGLNLQQLVQKFLLGAVTYSQAAEDYLLPAKGLMAKNITGDKEGTKPYTSLEHQWDEGFGYFGAAQDYNRYTDAENKAQQDNDTNNDGMIDLYSEYSFGNSVNAAKRDKGATVATDFSQNAMNAFIKGRAIIQANIGTNPVEKEGYHVELVAQAKIALNNWEKAVAATVVHYINDVIADYANFGTADFNQGDMIKHWSEMKGFALGLQFSPEALIAIADLKTVHTAFGEKPELVGADAASIAAYIVKLEAARATLQTAYSFNAENVANW